jgi:hypothetical protein
MPELGPYGSVRGARGDSRPYREHDPKGPIRSRLTRKRHAVSRDDICRVQERFSVIELCLLKLGCWPVLGPIDLF